MIAFGNWEELLPSKVIISYVQYQPTALCTSAVNKGELKQAKSLGYKPPLGGKLVHLLYLRRGEQQADASGRIGQLDSLYAAAICSLGGCYRRSHSELCGVFLNRLARVLPSELSCKFLMDSLGFLVTPSTI